MTGLLCYASDAGEDEVFRWYEAQSPNVRAAARVVISGLRNRPYPFWRRKPFAVLHGASCMGLGEVRIEEPRGVHYRIIGYLTPRAEYFVLLYAFGKDNDPEYRYACPEAQKRRKDVERNQCRTRGCQF